MFAIPQAVEISIHPPREGWDLSCCWLGKAMEQFQSTHPVRGGTTYRSFRKRRYRFQSTHPVRGGTDPWTDADQLAAISIHPPREGWDNSIFRPGLLRRYFNPPTP